MALEVLKEGLKHRDSSTKQVSRSALQLLGQKVPAGSAPQKQAAKKDGCEKRNKNPRCRS